ncbi:MAG: hypothetical protein LBR61_09110 [Synergistaceae bacterium]|jgi:medium-chain acyl-[acyl-carrier-protein] hydrolase|nr:hypothetical protein [Synergistaceae bacterium]
MYTRKLNVLPSGAGCTGQIKLRNLLDCLQDTASLAVQDVEGTPGALMSRGYAWVLLKYDLDVVLRLPAMDETFEIRTWHMPDSGFYTLRVFEIDGEGPGGLLPLVRAKTSWILLDLAAGRPVRPIKHLPEVFTRDAQPISADFRDVPKAGTAPVREAMFPVRFHDLDANIHVNNAVYFEWLFEATPLDLTAWGVKSMSAEFRVSAKPGDTIRVEVQERPGGGVKNAPEYLYTMWSTAEPDDSRGGRRPLARFRCLWEPLEAAGRN